MPTFTKTIDSNAFIGVESTQLLTSDTAIFGPVFQTILSDSFVGEETTQTIESDTNILITTTQTIDSNSEIKEPLDFLAEVQVIKLFQDDKEVETDVDNPIPAAPTGLTCSDAGLGDAINLSWTSTANFFNVFRKDPGPTFVKLNDNLIESTTYVTGGHTPDVPVTFVVRGVNGIGEESPNSNEVTCTPTFAIERCRTFTTEVKISSSTVTDAILQNVTLGFGSNISSANFTLPRDPRPSANPGLDATVDIIVNGRLIFKGFITTRSNIISEDGGLRISYTCSSTIINLTKSTNSSATVDGVGVRFNTLVVNPDGESQILNRSNTDQILNGLGVVGGPGTFPGAVDITDMTSLAAAELVLSKSGSFKLYHDMASGVTSSYAFGSGGLVTREFEFGKNVMDFSVQESNVDTVNSVTVIGGTTTIRKKQRLVFRPGLSGSGALVSQARVGGRNIRDIQVFGFTREKPRVTFDDTIQVSLLDFGVTAGRSSFFLRRKEIKSTISFGSGNSSTTRNVTFDPVGRTASISTGSGTNTTSLSQGSSFIDPVSGNTLNANFTRSGEFQLIGSQSGSTGTIIGTNAASSVGSRLFSGLFFGDATRDNTTNLSEDDVKLRPIIIREKAYRTERQAMGAVIEYSGTGSATINLSRLPLVWRTETKTGRVDRSLIGAGQGTFTARVLIGYDWSIGAAEVEFTVDDDPPTVGAGSGLPSRTITDSQYSIINDSVTGFSNQGRILSEMSVRASNELAGKNQIFKSGSITVVGDEQLDLRQSIRVNGDKLEVSGVTHSFTNGFTTTVNLTNERFFALTTLQPDLTTRRDRRDEERGRSGISRTFLNRELLEAKKELQRSRDAQDKDPQDSGPYAIYGGGTS